MSNSNKALLPSSILSSLQIIDGTIYCSSLDVAENFKKEHFNVIRDIENNITQVADIRYKLKSEYIESLFRKSDYAITTGVGTKVKKPMYLLSRDGFTLLAMGYTGKKAMKFKLEYIEAFNQMESELLNEGNCFSPLTKEHQTRLYKAATERSNTSPISRGELLAQLRHTFDVRSWKDIDDNRFSDAVILVKTLVVEDTDLIKPRTIESEIDVSVMDIRELRNIARLRFGVQSLGRIDTKTAREMVKSMLINEDTVPYQDLSNANFISMVSKQLQALSVMAHSNIDEVSEEISENYWWIVNNLSAQISHVNSTEGAI